MSEKPDLQMSDLEAGNFSYPEDYAFNAGYGITDKTIDYISDVKNDPDWIRAFRHRALEIFQKKPNPTHWASHDLDNIHFDKIRYYLAKGQQASRN